MATQGNATPGAASAPGPRDLMIACAAELLARAGTPGASMGAVLAHSGAPRGSIYHHFPGGKAQLLTEALASVAARSEAMGGSLRGSPAEVVGGFLGLWERLLTATDYSVGCAALGAVVTDSEDEVVQAGERALGAWESLLQAAFADGGVEREAASDLATTVLSAAEGAVALARARRSLEPLRAAGRMLGPLAAGLGPRAQEPGAEEVAG